MSEYGRERPDVDLVVWAEGVGHETVTPMDPAKVLVGYAFEDPIAFDEYNSHMQRLGALLHWLEGCAIREFSSLAAACASDIEIGRRFTVRRTTCGRGGSYLSRAGTRTGDVELLTTDGAHVYYTQGGYLVAVDPDAPTVEVWARELTGVTTPLWLSCDGSHVFLAATVSSGEEVRVYNADDGADTTVWGTGVSGAGTPFILAVSTGVFVMLINADGSGACFLRDTAGASDNVVHGAVVSAVCVSGALGFIGGLQGTDDYHVRAMALSVSGSTYMSEAWGYQIPVTTGTPDIKGLACDGELLFATGTNITDTPWYGNTWCFVAATGELLWRANASTASGNGQRVAVDDRYVYVSDTATTFALDKHTGTIMFTMAGVRPDPPFEADGVNVYGPSTSNWRVVSTGGLPSKGFVRVSDTDPDRRPFYKLAVPE